MFGGIDSLHCTNVSEAIMHSGRMLHRIPISKCRRKDILQVCKTYMCRWFEPSRVPDT